MIKKEVEEFIIFEDNVIELVLEVVSQLFDYKIIVEVQGQSIEDVLNKIKEVGDVVIEVCDKI